MSAYENLQMFYKAQEVKDPWALGHYLARTHGKHTQQEYAAGIEGKRGSKEWNPVGSAAKEKKEKAKAKKEAKAAEGKKARARAGGLEAARRYRSGEGGRQARMKLSLDDVIAQLNLLKEDKIKEDDKDEHEDKEPIKDPFAVATWRAEREGHDLSTDEGKERRKEIVENIKDEGNVVEDKDLKKAISLQKISPGLAGLMAAAAGWVMSDDIVRSGGGSPRGEMTPQQVRDWERTLRRTMRKKDVSLDKSSWEKLQKTYYDDSDLYFRRVPVQNAVAISKDHAPIPPRQGLQWDEFKKKWVSPDHVGRSASELQGKKRIRGSGTGVHEHALHTGGAGGKGVGSGVAGRRFRSVGDSGVQSPHESKHVAGYKRRTSGGGHLPSVASTSSARAARRYRTRRPSVTKRIHYGPGRLAAQMKPMPEAKGPAIKQ